MSVSIAEGDDALYRRSLARVIRSETWRRERIVSHFRFALFSLVGLAEWVQRSGHDHPHLSAMPFVFLGWGVAVGILNQTWLRRSFREWVPAAITTVDIVVYTITTHIVYSHALQYGEHTLREIDRAMVGLIVIISVNMIRFSWRTSVWSGVCALASLGYLRAYSGTFGQTAAITDFLVFIIVVALLVESNRSVRTVTARLHLDLRHAQQQRLASLRALVAGVSHEVNSPLGAISSNVQLAARAADVLEEEGAGEQPRARRALDTLRRSAKDDGEAVTRISSIIHTLRDFARLDEAEVRRVDLRSDLDACIDVVATQAGAGIRFHRRYAEPLDITCRPGQLNQAFMHVLRNALESIEGTGEITVSGRNEDGAVVVEIADTGRGIPRRKLDGIFDLRFSSRVQRVGMGLGLPISHSIVEDHGGEIRIESEEGKGTTVTIVLPAT